MIEVLVAMTVMAVGMLGLVSLQARSATWQRDAHERRSATELTMQLVDRMRANYGGLAWEAAPGAGRTNAYQAAFPPGSAVPPLGPGAEAGAAMTPGDVAARDLALWMRELRQRIPSAAAVVAQDAAAGNTLMVITVGWRDPLSAGVDGTCAAAGMAVQGLRCIATGIFP